MSELGPGQPADPAALADELAISGLLVHYAYCLDSRQYRRMADEVFAPEATDDHGMGIWDGREAIAAAFEKMMPQYVATGHVFTNHRISITGDTARCSAYVSGWHWLDTPGAPTVRPADFLILGVYLDDLERRSGRWWVVRRRYRNLGPSALASGQLPDSLRPRS